MSLEGEFLAWQARLRIIRSLLGENGLPWTRLLQETKLSTRSLTSRLGDLLKEGIIKKTPLEGEKPGNTDVGGKSQMVYSITQEGIKEFSDVFKPLDEALSVEKKVVEFEQLFFERARLFGERDIAKLSIKYFDIVSKAAIQIFEIELLRAHSKDFTDSYISMEILSVVRKMFWENDFVRKFEQDTKRSLAEEKKSNKRTLDREIRILRSDIAKRK